MSVFQRPLLVRLLITFAQMSPILVSPLFFMLQHFVSIIRVPMNCMSLGTRDAKR